MSETLAACQAVNHPYLVIYSPTSSSAAEHAQKALDAKAAAGLCPLCHDPFEAGGGPPPCVENMSNSRSCRPVQCGVIHWTYRVARCSGCVARIR